MIPIRDENPRSVSPVFTIGLIAVNVLVFIYELRFGLGPVISQYGLVSTNVVQLRSLETFFTSMFLHAGFLHLAGNMLYLWIFGDNIESYLGHVRFLVFYFICGLCAALTHIVVSGVSDVPMVGASGAVSGILGGYLIKYPKARVLVLIPVFWFLFFRRIPAIFVLGFWFAMQLFSGVIAIGIPGGGIAFWAHVGGFVAGVVLINLFSSKKHVVSY